MQVVAKLKAKQTKQKLAIAEVGETENVGVDYLTNKMHIHIDKTYTIIADHFNLKGKLYNKAGDKVKVITAEQNTWIVENKAGERYAISKFKLKIDE